MNQSKSRPASYLYFLFATCFLGGVFGGTTATLMSAYLPNVVKEFGGATAETADRIGAAINAAYLFGMMFGGLAIGFLSDRFGRKPAVKIAIATLGAFTLLTGFSNDWATIGVFRFCTGFGVGGILVASVTIIGEEWPERTRHIALGILSITIPVGIFSAGLITYNFSDWRKGFSVGAIPLLLAIVAQFLLHESEKWQQSRLFSQKEKSSGTGLFRPENRRDLLVGSIIYGTMLIGLWAVFAWLPTWVQTLVSDGDGQKERGTSMMLFAIGGLAGGFSSGWVTRKFGVKKVMLVCFAATFALTFFLFKTNTSLNLILWAEIGGIALFFGLSQGVLNVYIPNLFPVEIRSMATGFCFNICRVFTATVVFFVGWLEAALGGYGNALFSFSFVFLIGWVAALFASEKQLL